MKAFTLHRIEHKETQSGMWYNFDGSYNGVIGTLEKAKSREFPMPYNELHHKNGKQWLSGVKSLDELVEWFSEEDIKDLLALGYTLYRIESTEYNLLETEILFTREGVISKTEVDVNTIF